MDASRGSLGENFLSSCKLELCIIQGPLTLWIPGPRMDLMMYHHPSPHPFPVNTQIVAIVTTLLEHK